MNILMNRSALWLAISSPCGINIKNLVFALAAGTVIFITAGCGKAQETPVGTNAALTAEQRTSDAGPDGHWEGDITGDGPLRMRVTLDLAKNAKSEWIASMGVPSANKTGLVVKDVVVNGKSVKFVAVELMMAAFDLTLGPDGSMKGNDLQPSAPSPSNSSARARRRWNWSQPARRCRRHWKEIGKARSRRPAARPRWYSISRTNRTRR